MEVIIKIKIDDAVLVRMRKGEFVQGSLHYDQWTGEKQFNAYVRKSRLHIKDKVVKKLPWGWVKESMENQKRVTSFSKHLPLAEKLQILDSENELAKKILVERELNLIEFC